MERTAKGDRIQTSHQRPVKKWLSGLTTRRRRRGERRAWDRGLSSVSLGRRMCARRRGRRRRASGRCGGAAGPRRGRSGQRGGSRTGDVALPFSKRRQALPFIGRRSMRRRLILVELGTRDLRERARIFYPTMTVRASGVYWFWKLKKRGMFCPRFPWRH